MTSHDLHQHFLRPGRQWGPVPFFWWSGGAVDRDKLCWQLDQLRDAGLAGVLVGYSHRADGSLDADDPTPLTDEWWELFTWFVGACAERGLTCGLQDYILLNDILRAAGASTPGRGAATLTAQVSNARDGEPTPIRVPQDCVQIMAFAPDGGATELTALATAVLPGGEISWTAPGPGWEIVVIAAEPATLYGQPLAFDVLHPGSGQAVIDTFYEQFAARLGEHLGRTFTLFFQDELDLGIRMPMWSARIPEEFRRRKGYDVLPVLAALWRDLGEDSRRVRLDYADVVVALLEENYFRPVHAWHRAHGTTLAMDQLGRGEPRLGHAAYADYARTMRWFDAPGNEDPKLHEPRHLETFKVNSSLAHLYERPRVWNEAFHSSGWGVSPADVLAGLDAGFTFGATGVSLHGLYHHTRGGWWEWASPDFHYRQPYWDHITGMWHHITRLSWLLSQGSHGCDVAVLDPWADLASRPTPLAVGPTSDDTASSSPADGHPDAADVAPALVRGLVTAGCDADVLDDESLARAVSAEALLTVSGERYRVVVIPAMRWIRASAAAALARFTAAGGTVLAYGRIPDVVPDTAGGRPLPAATAEFVTGLVPFAVDGGDGADDVLARIDAAVRRDVITGVDGVAVCHRRWEDADVYLLANISGERRALTSLLVAAGPVERWDPRTGTRTLLPAVRADGDAARAAVSLDLAPGESALLVTGRDLGAAGAPPRPAGRAGGREVAAVPAGDWRFRIVPTLDNRYGDFRLPAGTLGIEAHDLDVVQGQVRRPIRVTYGPRLLHLGPLPAADADAVLAGLLAGDRPSGEGLPGRCGWEPYVFSESLGIQGDPLLQDLQTGPHGLKGEVPLEFLDLSGPLPDGPRPEDAGAVSLLWTTFRSTGGPVTVVAGSRAAYTVWLNGTEVTGQPDALAPAFFPPWDVPDHRSPEQRATVAADDGVNTVVVRLVHPPDARLRAYVAVFPGDDAAREGTACPESAAEETGKDCPPALRWWAGDAPALPFDAFPGEEPAWQHFTVTAPPGLLTLRADVHGEVEIRCDAGGPDEVRTTHLPGTAPSPGTAHLPGTARRVEGRWNRPVPHAVAVTVRVRPVAGKRDGAVFAGPVTFTCGEGLAPAGDWSALGLAAYSGKAVYTTEVELGEVPDGARVVLDLGDVAVSAAVTVNDVPAGEVFAPPFELDITGAVRGGTNTVQIEVANTLASFYSTLPTPFVLPGQQRSGLLGPVRVLVEPAT